MNADYPFMIPKIVGRTEKTVTLEGRGGETITVPIEDGRNGGEMCFVEQSSSFEKTTGAKPQRFQCNPFKDDRTEVIEQ